MQQLCHGLTIEIGPVTGRVTAHLACEYAEYVKYAKYVKYERKNMLVEDLLSNSHAKVLL
jgi:hypothetical protein